jgi:RNA polymerase sigma factor (sigma-70 family)
MTTVPIDLALRHELPAAAGGDREAYGRIVAASQNAITAIALAITRDVHASEDIAQEAFIKGWRQLATLNNPDSFLPWLREITRNLARDHLRAQRRRPITGQAVELAMTLAADTAPTPAETLLHTEQESAALEAIATLPEDSREVLLLYYREGQRSRQVAQLLGLTDAAVRKRLSRARQCVREELLRRFGEYALGTAPSAAFASAVMGMLGLAAPPAAGAAILGGGGSAVAGKGLVKLFGASIGIAVAGVLLAVGAVWFGIRKQLRDPLDARERRALLGYGAFNTTLIVAFIVGISWLNHVPGWLPHVTLTLAYMAGIWWSCSYWLPKILARRSTRDLLRDPEGTARALQRQRAWGKWGLRIGVACACAGLFAGLVSSGRLSF